MSVLSNNRQYINGDLYVGRGQLGLGWRGSATTGTDLWSLTYAANHYLIDPSTNNAIVVLPVVGTLNTQAQPGHWVTIINIATINNLVINNSSGVTVATLSPSKSIMFIADSAAVTSWVVQYDTSTYGIPTTLQGSYNASAGANPQIQLTSAGSQLRIRDYTANTTDIFSISNNANTYKYINASNNGSNNTHFVGLLNGNANSGTNNASIGSMTVDGNGIIGVCDSVTAYTGYNTSNRYYTVFTNGEHHYGGAINEGTAKTSPNERITYSTINAVTTAGTTINIAVLPSTTYSFNIDIYGRDVTTSSLVSVRHKLEALVAVNAANTPSVIGQTISTMETIGFTSFPANATLGISGTNVTLTVNAPDNVVAPSSAMDFRVVIKANILTE